MSRKVVFVTTHPVQYIVPLYQELTREGTVDFEVVYLTDETVKGSFDKHFGREVKWDLPLLDNYRYQFLKNFSWKPSLNTGFWGLMNFGIVSYLWKQPSKSIIIISGWSNLSFVLTIIFGKLFGHHCAFRMEAPLYKEENRTGILNNIRYHSLRFMFRYFIDYSFYIGSQNKAFYEKYRLKPEQLFFTPYCVDNKRFSEDFDKLSSHRNEIREKLKIPLNAYVILFTGKFYDIKRPLDLLSAYIAAELDNKFLVMVGDGIMMSEIQKNIKESGLNTIQLPGFKNQTEISEYYVIADVLVLCSESETWGLSVNEAMNFNLPIILYDSVGCGPDLLKDSVNGKLVKKGNILELQKALEFYGNDRRERERAGVESKRIIKDFSFEKIIIGLKSALA